ncbi:hypothetical protein [Fimbriimonas ginsengisoli]|uniref:Uncharacterized protein n=1 Tax=Fimbriimonas ginsengisoli Gsoil 348 TaxID=661478 RepID=A0A068NTI0_FIMGI|nr:hypothetical protein [Fimbriimonas ginsengisoli]AIE86751.1 hypothetical protein OP10G_3383 [Fimbriimonas ginsengisoli Gsoil 348]
MTRSYWKIISATATLALLTALAMPQSGPIGKRGGSGGGGSSSGGGGGSRGGGSGSGGGHSSGGGSSNSGGGSSNSGGGQREDRGGSRGGSRSGGDSGGGYGGGSQGGGGPIFSGGGGGTRSGGDQGGGGIVISGDQDGGTRRRHDSRSGRVQYGTNDNAYIHGRSGPVRIDRAPVIINNGQLQRRVGQNERGVGIVRGGYRYGYYHYRRDWQDDWFCYPYYAFDPFRFDRCVTSPWYYYVSCPPYLNYSRVTIVNVYPTSNWSGDNYDWRPIDQYDRNARYEDLDYAIEDIVDVFQNGSRRSLDRLVPRRGSVNIYTEGNYSYSLGADDFYDLYQDGMENVNTVRYQIVDVQRDRNGNARVLARHEFIDPWNQRQTVWHTYYLQRERRDYVIREFGTSYYRQGW